MKAGCSEKPSDHAKIGERSDMQENALVQKLQHLASQDNEFFLKNDMKMTSWKF